MLVLAREVDQTIMVGDDIKITVVALNGRRVKIGVEAPKSLPVDREEIYVEKKRDRDLQKKNHAKTKTKCPTCGHPL
jgi:carbon storage regulator